MPEGAETKEPKEAEQGLPPAKEDPPDPEGEDVSQDDVPPPPPEDPPESKKPESSLAPQVEAGLKKVFGEVPNYAASGEDPHTAHLVAKHEAKKARQIAEHTRVSLDVRDPSPDLNLPDKPSGVRLYRRFKTFDLEGRPVLNAFTLRPDKDFIAYDIMKAYADDSRCPVSLRKDIYTWLKTLKPYKIVD